MVALRIPKELLAEIADEIARSQNRFNEPYDRSSWIIKAIREKLDHLKRSRKPRPRKPSAEGPSAAEAVAPVAELSAATDSPTL